jgi:hypothetical protein
VHTKAAWLFGPARTIVAILIAVSLDSPVLAQGRTSSATAAGGSGRPALSGDATGRRQGGHPIPVQTDTCVTDDIRCRVVQALGTTIRPGLFAPGDELRRFASPNKTLAVKICPCGGDCLPYPQYGWPESNLGWGIANASRVALAFHLSQPTTELLSSQRQVSFRLMWSQSGEGDRAPLVSSEIVTFGKGFARPIVQSTCRE